MSEIKNLIDELQRIHTGDAWHGLPLKALLDDVTPEQAHAHPQEGFHSICELVLHIGVWELVFAQRLEGQTKKEPDQGDFPDAGDKSPESWKAAVQLLDQNHDYLIKVASGLSDADLERIVPGKDFTFAFMLHGIVRHHVYHAGQIGLLKKLLQRSN